MCLPELDAPSVFGAAIDAVGGGCFALAPAIPYEVERRYVERTNVLQTEFRTANGAVRVTDAVTTDLGDEAPWRELVRRIEGLAGTVPLEWRCEPRFDLGREQPEIERRGEAWTARAGTLQLGLQAWSAGDPGAAHGAVAASFDLAERQTALLALTVSDGEPLPLPRREAVERRLEVTIDHWRRWVARRRYEGRWTEMVERSLLRAQAAGRRAHRSAGRRRHDVAARGHRRRPQLRLPLRLGPRRRLRHGRAHAARLGPVRRVASRRVASRSIPHVPSLTDELADVVVPDQDGTEVRLGDLWADRAVALVWLRHYG